MKKLPDPNHLYQLLYQISEENASSIIKKSVLEKSLNDRGYQWSELSNILENKNIIPRPKRGYYDLSQFDYEVDNSIEIAQIASEKPKLPNISQYIPSHDRSYVKWGNYNDVETIISSKRFFPIYISGESGNGKTVMVKQACSNLNREFIRVQIRPDTSEDDLLGGFRLKDGDTVFEDGPVITAMRRGAILLIDEVDRGTNRIMCLQGVLEGSPILISKTGEIVKPQEGFNVIATGNTQGRGSASGKYIAASIIDDAFLERFYIMINQNYPPPTTEKSILISHAKDIGMTEAEYGTLVVNLAQWAKKIRENASDDEDVISTRRLIQVLETAHIFKNEEKAIKLCVARFEEKDSKAFFQLYKSVKKETIDAEAEKREEKLFEKASQASSKVLNKHKPIITKSISRKR